MQRLLRKARIGEVERADLDRRATGGAPRVPGDRPHRAARGQEMPGDRRPRVAERAGDDVEAIRYWPLPARLTGCRARHADPLSWAVIPVAAMQVTDQGLS